MIKPTNQHQKKKKRFLFIMREMPALSSHMSQWTAWLGCPLLLESTPRPPRTSYHCLPGLVMGTLGHIVSILTSTGKQSLEVHPPVHRQY